MVCLPFIVLCTSLLSVTNVQNDPLGLKTSYRSWAEELAQSSLEALHPMLHPPVQIVWDETDLYSRDELLQIKSAFDENLALRSMETIPSSEQKNSANTIITCTFLQESWSKSLGLRVKLFYPGEKGYYIAIFPISGKQFEPSALNDISFDSAQALVKSWQSLAISSTIGITFPQINSAQEGMTDSTGYYSTVLAADISRSLPFILSDSADSAILTGNVTCVFKNIKKPERRCNEMALALNLTGAKGNPLWSGRFIGEREELSINSRLRYLEEKIAVNQSQALIIGGLGLPLTTAGVAIWYQNYQARMDKLDEGAIPGSTASTNLGAGEYIGIAMGAIGGAGLVYAVQAVITALNYEAERENILKSNLLTP
jgi:hypothetical protein